MTDHIPARTAWDEARGGGSEAMQAVLCVIRNRALDTSGAWPDTYDAVCLQPDQFSCWNAGDPNRIKGDDVTSADPQFAEALRLEAAMLANPSTLDDITGGAAYYYALRIPSPSWVRRAGLVYTRTIGGQAFYRRPYVGRAMMIADAPAPKPSMMTRVITAAAVQLCEPTSIGGEALIAGSLVAAAMHQVTWPHALISIVPSVVLIGIPQRFAALRKPLAEVIRDAALAVATGRINQAAVSGDVNDFVQALRDLAGGAVPDEQPPGNEPFPVPVAPVVAPAAEPIAA